MDFTIHISGIGAADLIVRDEWDSCLDIRIRNTLVLVDGNETCATPTGVRNRLGPLRKRRVYQRIIPGWPKDVTRMRCSTRQNTRFVRCRLDELNFILSSSVCTWLHLSAREFQCALHVAASEMLTIVLCKL